MTYDSYGNAIAALSASILHAVLEYSIIRSINIVQVVQAKDVQAEDFTHEIIELRRPDLLKRVPVNTINILTDHRREETRSYAFRGNDTPWIIDGYPSGIRSLGS